MVFFIQLIYLVVCVGICFVCAIMMPELFAPGNYVGVVIIALIAFIWFYGNKMLIRWYLKYSGKEAKSPLDRNKF